MPLTCEQENRQVSKEEGVAFARKHAMMYIECSAKTKLGIQQAFEELVQKVRGIVLLSPPFPSSSPLSLASFQVV